MNPEKTAWRGIDFHIVNGCLHWRFLSRKSKQFLSCCLTQVSNRFQTPTILMWRQITLKLQVVYTRDTEVVAQNATKTASSCATKKKPTLVPRIFVPLDQRSWNARPWKNSFENTGLPVELHMPNFQMKDQRAPWNFTSDYLYCLSNQSKSILEWNPGYQCGPDSIPGPGVICGLSLLLVLVLTPRVFLRVLRFSTLHKNQHSKNPFDLGSVDE